MPPTPNVPAITPRRILVVDDEPSVAQTMRLILSIDRHQIEVAADGETGLAMFDAGRHDLVITDFKMTNMDGLELARAIRGLCPGQRIILVSAYLEALQSNQARLSNVNTLLGKPFSTASLRAAIAELFPAA
jgi:two-component system cell cycle response regulator CpdR